VLAAPIGVAVTGTPHPKRKGTGNMDATVVTHGDTTRIHVIGAIDEKGANHLLATFKSVGLAGQKMISFDFGQVSHIGSAGMGKLLIFYQELSSRGLGMRVENAPADIQTLLREVAIDNLFQVN
jgi:anti-anti-sigma factor